MKVVDVAVNEVTVVNAPNGLVVAVQFSPPSVDVYIRAEPTIHIIPLVYAILRIVSVDGKVFVTQLTPSVETQTLSVAAGAFVFDCIAIYRDPALIILETLPKPIPFKSQVTPSVDDPV